MKLRHLPFILLPLAAGLTGGQARAEAQQLPNVLFIAVDDLKPLLGCYGAEVHTPNIDRLAAQGTVFLNNQCQQAVCGPSRASLMTGLRPDSTGVYDLKTRARDINPDVLTIPQFFREQGYVAHGFGKIEDPRTFNNGEKGANRTKYDPQSWDSYDRVDRGENVGLDPNGERYPVWAADVPDNTYPDGIMAELAVEKMEELAAADEAFFLAVGFKKPHLPFVAPKKYWDLYEREEVPVEEWQTAPIGAPEYAMHESSELRNGYGGDVPDSGPIPEEVQRELNHGYHACVSYIDAQVGMLLDQVETLGLREETIIVLWGDHGFHLGDHGMYCKHSNFEQAARSPLIIWTPSQRKAGTATASPTEFVDIFPTLTELAGLPTPDVLEGTSLVPLLNDPQRVLKLAAVSQYPRGGGNSKRMGYSYRTPRYRFTAWTPFDPADQSIVEMELYDYDRDPQETRNLAGEAEYSRLVSAFQELHAADWEALETETIPAIFLNHKTAEALPVFAEFARKETTMQELMKKMGAASVAAAATFAAPVEAQPAASMAASGESVLQSFAYPAGAALTAQPGWAPVNGAAGLTILSQSLIPSDPAVAAKLAAPTGGSLLVTSAGDSTNAMWSLGEAVKNRDHVVYYSFLIRPEVLPFNGEVVGLRRHENGGGASFQLRGDFGKGKGGTQGGGTSAFALRPDKTDFPGIGGETRTMELDGSATYFVVVKAEAAPDFGASGEEAHLRMTTWLNPDPSQPETAATVWQTAMEKGSSPKNVQWFSVGVHKDKTKLAIDEIRVGKTWESVTPTK